MIRGETLLLFNPKKEINEQNIIATIPSNRVLSNLLDMKSKMELHASLIFRVLEREWSNLGYILADFKIEFGFNWFGELLVSDVIDNDSWRVIDAKGEHLDKQVYREGADLETVKGMYSKVAELSEKFAK